MDDMNFDGFESVWQRVMQPDKSAEVPPEPEKAPPLCIIKPQRISHATRFIFR